MGPRLVLPDLCRLLPIHLSSGSLHFIFPNLRNTITKPTISSVLGGSRCRLPDPGGSRLVTVPPGVMPGAGKDVAVVAKRAPVVRWRVPLLDPYRQGVPFELVDVVDCVAPVGVEAAPYLFTRLGTERPLVAETSTPVIL